MMGQMMKPIPDRPHPSPQLDPYSSPPLQLLLPQPLAYPYPCPYPHP